MDRGALVLTMLVLAPGLVHADAPFPEAPFFFVDLPELVLLGGPVVADGYATFFVGGGFVRVDLASAHVTTVGAVVPSQPAHLATAAGRLYVVTGEAVYAFNARGDRLWATAALPDSGLPVGAPAVTRCAPPLVRPPALYVQCTKDDSGSVRRLGLADGRVEWTWERPVTGAPAETAAPSVAEIDSAREPPACNACVPLGLAWSGDLVAASFSELSRGQAGSSGGGWGVSSDETWGLVWGLDPLSGEGRWSRDRPSTYRVYVEENTVPGGAGSFSVTAPPAWDGASVLARFDDLEAYDPRTGNLAWSQALPLDDTPRGTERLAKVEPGDHSEIASAEGAVFVRAPGRVYVVERSAGILANLSAQEAGVERWTAGPVLVGQSGVFLGMAERGARILVAFGTDGALQGTHAVPADVDRIVSDGSRLLLVDTQMRRVWVMGGPPSTFDPVITLPAEGVHRVEVDLRGAPAGPHGAATSFRADWGDGAVTAWVPDARLSHEYAAPGIYDARFFLRNDAGETAVVGRTLAVGPVVADDPLSPAEVVPAGPAGSSGPTVLGMPPAVALLALLLLLALLVLLLVLLLARRRRPVEEPTPGALFLGKYEVERELGAGTFGVAWLATHRALARKVVIKQLRREWSLRGDAATRFRREARILAALDHPNVTRVYDVEEVGRAWYIVMEFVDGGSLEERALPLEPAAAVQTMLQALEGLAYVHARGVVHRDLKPANVLVTREGVAKLADFGVARGRDLDATMQTMAGTPGTPVFMSPEQIAGHQGDHRSDLYAAAATAFRLLTGELYFGRAPLDAAELRRLVLEQRPRIPAWLGPALGAWLAKGLEKAPEARFESADEMRRALLAAMGAGLPTAPPRRIEPGATVSAA